MNDDPTAQTFGPGFARKKWAWAHLSLVSKTDLDHALATVRGMNSQERMELLEAALTTQACLLRIKPQLVTWHEHLRTMWTGEIVGEVTTEQAAPW